MNTQQLLQQGHLHAAVKHVTESVRNNPGDLRLRISLFELLCFSGDLERARKHLEVAGQNSAESELAIHRYLQLLTAEGKRRACFTSGGRPKLLSPAPSAETYLAGLEQFREGHIERSRELLEEAEEQRSASTCFVNDVPFEDFRDGNDLLGPFAELMVQDEYCWIPWDAIVSMSVQPPKHLRDLMWIPVQLELQTGSGGEVFFPVLYYDSYLSGDENVALGRETLWRDDVEGLSIGLGQKLFYAGDKDFALLEIQNLRFEHAIAQAG